MISWASYTNSTAKTFSQSKASKLSPRKGFTIVELLIVVVVIAILAAITIVAYNSIRRSAVETSVKTELSSHRKGFALEQIGKGGSDYNPSDSAYIFKSTASADIEYSYGNRSSYCMTAQSKSDSSIIYHIVDGDENTIKPGVCPAVDYSTTYRCAAGIVRSIATLKNTTSQSISLRTFHSSTGDQEDPTPLAPGETRTINYSLRTSSVGRSIITFSVYTPSGSLIETYYQSNKGVTCN